MSIYDQQPLDRHGLRTVPLSERPGKARVGDFARPYEKGGGVPALLDSLPRILAGNSLRAIVQVIRNARDKGKAILWGLGGHVVKVGLSPVLIDLMERGLVSAIAMNGATAIHDFEIALGGSTSEDVDHTLPGGRFGTAEETGAWMNQAICEADRSQIGIGEGLGQFLQKKLEQTGGASSQVPFAKASLLVAAYQRKVPVTVHVAIGTDTPHNHPLADGRAIGGASYRDFLLLAGLLRNLHDGGIYLNVGSAVVLPEVFLKAVSAIRNLGHPLQNFTTVNLDFLQHYRPLENVVRRPTLDSGQGYALTGHHEILLPLMAAALIEHG